MIFDEASQITTWDAIGAIAWGKQTIETVTDALSKHGWKVVRQIGSSHNIIDLAIVHPDDQSKYLAGIICDGPGSLGHTVGDREKTTISMLTGLGWSILRIWSASWWHDPSGAAARVNRQLQDLAGG